MSGGSCENHEHCKFLFVRLYVPVLPIDRINVCCSAFFPAAPRRQNHTHTTPPCFRWLSPRFMYVLLLCHYSFATVANISSRAHVIMHLSVDASPMFLV